MANIQSGIGIIGTGLDVVAQVRRYIALQESLANWGEKIVGHCTFHYDWFAKCSGELGTCTDLIDFSHTFTIFCLCSENRNGILLNP